MQSREGRRLAGIHVGAGRAVKEWPAERFAAVGARLAVDEGVTIVLTGAEEDRAAADVLRAALPPSVPCVNLVGRADILSLAAVFRRLDLLITADTGPMHLAAALDVPIVAVFGPSSPERWGPLSARCRIVRTDLPCSPCNRVRTPPARCVGHTPDCLEAVGTDAVLRAARELLADRPRLVPASSNTVS
jgi:ADP-heptose:LPS heptosyltransferase